MKIGYQRYEEVIIGVKGWLKAPDGNIVASVEEVKAQSGGEIAAKGSSFDSELKKGVHETYLIAILGRKALETIEDSRAKNRKGDVKLFLELAIRYFRTNALVSHLHAVNPEQAVGMKIQVPGLKEEKLVISAHDPEFSSSIRNMWIISGEGKPVFLANDCVNLEKEVIISSSDWIHDFAPKLGLGERFIVEVPTEGFIKEAWNYVEKAENYLRSWNTEGVFSSCREVGDLLDRTLKSELGKDSFAYEQKWRRVYEEFKQAASLDLHKEDIKRKEKYSPSEVRIGKEDAEFILISAKSLVKYAENLLQASG